LFRIVLSSFHILTPILRLRIYTQYFSYSPVSEFGFGQIRVCPKDFAIQAIIRRL